MSIDKFFDCKYDRRRYNCYHFTRDVWLDLTGRLLVLDESIFLNGKLTKAYVRQFVSIVKPVSPCIVVMQRKGFAPHVGVYVRGNVFHIQINGPEYQPVDVASRGFQTIRFALCPALQ